MNPPKYIAAAYSGKKLLFLTTADYTVVDCWDFFTGGLPQQLKKSDNSNYAVTFATVDRTDSEKDVFLVNHDNTLMKYILSEYGIYDYGRFQLPKTRETSAFTTFYDSNTGTKYYIQGLNNGSIILSEEGSSSPSFTINNAHSGVINELVTVQTRSGSRLATCDSEGVVNIWNLNNLNSITKVFSITQHTKSVNHLKAFTYKNIGYFVTGGDDGNIFVIDSENGDIAFSLNFDQPIGGIKPLNMHVTDRSKERWAIVCVTRNGLFQAWDFDSEKMITEVDHRGYKTTVNSMEALVNNREPQENVLRLAFSCPLTSCSWSPEGFTMIYTEISYH